MRFPDPRRLAAALEATWPAAACHAVGPFTFRDGAGGGRRVSAATAAREPTAAELASALAAFAAAGRPALFRLGPGEEALDRALAGHGLARADPTLLLVAPVAAVAAPAPGLEALAADAPTPALAALWDAGGTGRERLAVMARAAGPRVALLARAGEAAAGAAFVACDGEVAMLHALTVAPACRRLGIATAILRGAAGWAAGQGATAIAVATVEANGPARALFAALGFAVAGRYWYRSA
ncbi:MAG: GNAT family N-acetyltransferase [Rhodobacteraceae bacterium]|nr:GNAT family N-acetyltransferase [Paracoccaceae bacterium]